METIEIILNKKLFSSTEGDDMSTKNKQNNNQLTNPALIIFHQEQHSMLFAAVMLRFNEVRKKDSGKMGLLNNKTCVDQVHFTATAQ